MQGVLEKKKKKKLVYFAWATGCRFGRTKGNRAGERFGNRLWRDSSTRLKSPKSTWQAMRPTKVSEQRYNMMRTLSQEDHMGTHEKDAKGTKLLDYYGKLRKYVLESISSCSQSFSLPRFSFM